MKTKLKVKLEDTMEHLCACVEMYELNGFARSGKWGDVVKSLNSIKDSIDTINELVREEKKGPTVTDIRAAFSEHGCYSKFSYYRDKRQCYTRFKIYLDPTIVGNTVNSYDLAYICNELEERWPNYEFAAGFDFSPSRWNQALEKVCVIKFRKKDRADR